MFKQTSSGLDGAGFLALVAVALLLAGCGGDSSAEPESAETAPNIVQPGAPGKPSRTVSADELARFAAPAHIPADVFFMQGMIHHHAQALRMTSLVPKRAASPKLPLLAERMDISQESEIEQMQRWLLARHEAVPLLHREHGHAHGIGLGAMPGMLSERELRQLERARGSAFDRLFLRSMIRHHQGAVTMVRQLYAAGGGLESEADAFARHIEADQEIEIARMEQLLAGMG
jgi:uncharacterized protein (DUF305 family)